MRLYKLAFYFKRWHRDQTNPLIYDIGYGDFKSPQLREYYFLFSEEKLKAGGSQHFFFDDQGIPVLPTYIDIEEKKCITILYP